MAMSEGAFDLLQIRVYQTDSGMWMATEHDSKLYGFGGSPEYAASHYCELIGDLKEGDDDSE